MSNYGLPSSLHHLSINKPASRRRRFRDTTTLRMEASFEIFPNETNCGPDKDTFEGVFSLWYVNWLTILLYVLGLISCALLVIVSWFEKSGQAGPFRTLANQLVSCQLDQVR